MFVAYIALLHCYSQILGFLAQPALALVFSDIGAFHTSLVSEILYKTTKMQAYNTEHHYRGYKSEMRNWFIGRTTRKPPFDRSKPDLKWDDGSDLTKTVPTDVHEELQKPDEQYLPPMQVEPSCQRRSPRIRRMQIYRTPEPVDNEANNAYNNTKRLITKYQSFIAVLCLRRYLPVELVDMVIEVFMEIPYIPLPSDVEEQLALSLPEWEKENNRKFKRYKKSMRKLLANSSKQNIVSVCHISPVSSFVPTLTELSCPNSWEEL